MKNRVNNILIKDLIALLANLNLYHNAVDIILEPDRQRVIVNPAEEEPGENPNKVELRDNDLGDMI